MPGIAESLTEWVKKIQRFSDALPSLGMRTPEQEAARQKRLKQAEAETVQNAPKPPERK